MQLNTMRWVLLALCLSTTFASFGQIDITWSAGNNSGPDITNSGNAVFTNTTPNFMNCPHYQVSDNILWQCREGFIEATFEELGGVTPASDIEWVWALDEQFTGSSYTYAIRLRKTTSGQYELQAGKDYAPCLFTFTGTASLPVIITYNSSDVYRIARVRNSTTNSHTVTLSRNGVTIISFNAEPDKSLGAVANLEKFGAVIHANASFDGGCFNEDEDWSGASTGTLTPFNATDNVHIPAQLSVGTIPFNGLADQVLVTDASGLVSYRDVDNLGDSDWQTTVGDIPNSLSDDIFKAGTVGIGTSSNQARLHVDDIACDNLPAFRVSGPGVYTFCTSPNQHGPLMLAESQDPFGNQTPRFLVTHDGKVGIGTSTPLYALHVNGDIYASGNYYSSDRRYKRGIESLTNPLDVVMQLNGVSYEFRTDEFAEKKFRDGLHYGFIAQELQNVLPEIVDEDENGYLAVNYTAIIPILTEAVKTQQAQIEDLQMELELLRSKAQLQVNPSNGQEDDGNIFGNLELGARLEQNSPNPFTENTSISYFLPENTSTAELLIFDMNGKQLVRKDISGTGNGSISLSLGHLGAGMYMYSLIADNKEVDTKRMILTE